MKNYLLLNKEEKVNFKKSDLLKKYYKKDGKKSSGIKRLITSKFVFFQYE